MIPLMSQLANRPFATTLLSSLLLWCAFPPMGIAWFAPISILPLLLLIDREERLTRFEYLKIGLGSFALWLALLQGIRLAYWPLYAGWVVLALYLSVYLPLVIHTARIAVHRFGFPLYVAVPLSWVGWELFRSYFATGFATCLLGHTQVKQLWVIQIASHFGPYGVSAWVVLVGVASYHLCLILLRQASKRHGVGLAVGVLVALSVVGYGWWELGQAAQQPKTTLLKVALIQDNSPTMFESNRERNDRSWAAYLNETENAAKADGPFDVVVWPESVFTGNHPIMDVESQGVVPPNLKAYYEDFSEVEQAQKILAESYRIKVGRVLAAAAGDSMGNVPTVGGSNRGTHLLVGSDYLMVREKAADRYNAALWIGPDGKRIDLYAKRHLVMFGEYFPFGDWLPFLYSAFGMAPVVSGSKAVPLYCGDCLIAPSICFEDTLPHFLRNQALEIAAQDRFPDLMINVTNDGWFRGSSILDHHLASGIFGAVENRRPMLIAANTGLSAWIDSDGRLQKVSQRLAADRLIAEPNSDQREGLWRWIGDWPARICTFVCLLLWVFDRFSNQKDRSRISMLQSEDRTSPVEEVR